MSVGDQNVRSVLPRRLGLARAKPGVLPGPRIAPWWGGGAALPLRPQASPVLGSRHLLGLDCLPTFSSRNRHLFQLWREGPSLSAFLPLSHPTPTTLGKA